ncbi:uncharacterized protein LOC144132794 isoform X2 [Amblyomma americanum]
MNMASTTAFLLLGISAVFAAPESNASKVADSCDFSDMDLDNMVDAVVKKLPSEYLNPNLKVDKVIPGLTVGRMAYTGLDKLKTYGPVLPYCRDGLRLVQVDLASRDEELAAAMPWEYCGGKKGELGSRASGRVTVTFKVDDSSGNKEAKLVHHSEPKLVSIEKMSMYLYGAGDLIGGVFAACRLVLPEVPRSFWQDLLTTRLGAILKEI